MSIRLSAVAPFSRPVTCPGCGNLHAPKQRVCSSAPRSTIAPTRALSITPPWIFGILYLGKREENREWPESYAALAAARRIVASGERFYLHASGGSREDHARAQDWITAGKLGRLPPWEAFVRPPQGAAMTRSALVATARLTAIREPWTGQETPWGAPGARGLILADVSPLPAPIPMSGNLGFWKVDTSKLAGSAIIGR